MQTLPNRFLALEDDDSRYEDAHFVVLPIPYDATTSFASGTREGPRAILTASQQLEDYDEALGRESIQRGIHTMDALEPDARGPEQMAARITKTARRVVRDGKFLLALGGEHSITPGLVQAVRGTHKQVSVLQIDAHADLRDSYQGSKHSHACAMRRIFDMNVPHVGVGIRSYSKTEAAFIRKNDITLFTARECRNSATWIDDVVAHLTSPVYLTIDIDGFDPSVAPGTGTPEPGGLDWFQVTDLLAHVAERHEVVGADIVEVLPLAPSRVTEYLAARLAYRIIGLVDQQLR